MYGFGQWIQENNFDPTPPEVGLLALNVSSVLVRLSGQIWYGLINYEFFVHLKKIVISYRDVSAIGLSNPVLYFTEHGTNFGNGLIDSFVDIRQAGLQGNFESQELPVSL